MNLLSDPLQLGPKLLRNRTLRAAAFEGMCPGNSVREELIQYHISVARGGIGMTTVAYAAVYRTGLSFGHQLLLQGGALSGLQRLAEEVHCNGALVSAQIGHCGNMAKRATAGQRPLAPSSIPNLYAPCWPKAMSRKEISETVRDFGRAARLLRRAGFDAVEVHAGHGYLISQFLCPASNRRTDEFGGSLSRRQRFMKEVVEEVKDKTAGELAFLVKLNMYDGFSSGAGLEEGLENAQLLESLGVDALVLSAGFVSRSPMTVLHGHMPVQTLAEGMPGFWMKWFTRLFGHQLIPEVPFKENYFLKEARLFRKALKIPLIYVGGVRNIQNVQNVLDEGFEGIALARILIENPDAVRALMGEAQPEIRCDNCNHCVAVMYNDSFECNKR